jgi:PKD repeat protein
VWDNGAFNPIGCNIGVDCLPVESVPAFTTVMVVVNEPPVADADGPYVIDEGALLTLNGTGSYDPNGDIITYAWDLDNDAEYDDASGATPTYSWANDGTYTIGLKVSDSLLEDTDTTTVTVNDLAPTAEFTWTPEPQAECAAVSFTDASVSSPDIITEWSWDFGGIGTSSEQNPSFTFDDNGVYTVTLTVTDEDGSFDTVSHDVTITDKASAVNLTGDTSLNEGSTGNYDASGSTSSPDAIVSYEWDWDFDGTTFSPSGDTGPIHVHTWMDDGTYTAAVRLTDDDGSTDVATLQVTVNDLGPTAALTGDTSLIKGNAGSYDASGSTSSPDAIVSYEWDWEYDGVTFNASGDTGETQSHIWQDKGTYVAAVRVTDDDGSTDIATLEVTLTDLG